MISNPLGSEGGFNIFGVLFGAFVLAALIGLSVLVLEPGDMHKDIKKEIAENKQYLEHQSKKIEKLTARLNVLNSYHEKRPELELKEKTAAARSQRVDELVAEKEKLEEGLEALDNDFEDYQRQYRNAERKAAEGEIVDLSAIRDSRFEKAKILKVTPIGIRVGISTGVKAIPYNELPTAMQDRFQFGEEERARQMDARNQSSQLQGERLEAYKKKQARKAARRTLAQKQNSLKEMEKKIRDLKSTRERWIDAALEDERKSDEFRASANYKRIRGLPTGDGKTATSYARKASDKRKKADAIRDEINRIYDQISQTKKELASGPRIR